MGSESTKSKVASGSIDMSVSVLSLDQLTSLNATPFSQVKPEIYSDWYLKSCYPRTPFHDEIEILEFLVREARTLERSASLLDIGCGPVISHAMALSPYVERIDLSDYLPQNLELINAWMRGERSAHDWSLHTAHILRREKSLPSALNIAKREAEFRAKLNELRHGDLLASYPLHVPVTYPIVLSTYATEQAAQSPEQWLTVMDNLFRLVEPGGHLFLACVRDSDFYAIHDEHRTPLKLPIVRVTEEMIRYSCAMNGIENTHLLIESVAVDGLKEEGMNGIILVHAQKPR